MHSYGSPKVSNTYLHLIQVLFSQKLIWGISFHAHKGMQNVEPPPMQCGGNKSCNPQLPCQWPGLPPGLNGKVRSRGKISLTTQLVPILHQLLGQAAKSLNCLLQSLLYLCGNPTAVWKDWIKNYRAVKCPSHNGCKSAHLSTLKQHNACFISLFLPPPDFLFFPPPPYLIPFVNSVRYWRQALSFPLCLHSAVHGGWQLECHYNQRMSRGEDLRH